MEIVLIGNKSDRDLERKVSYEDALRYATDNNAQYFEVSAKSGFNVNLAFESTIN